MTPEHDKRKTGADEPLHPEVLAAYEYVENADPDLYENADPDVYEDDRIPYWGGWALREAFLAGITYAQQSQEAATKDAFFAGIRYQQLSHQP